MAAFPLLAEALPDPQSSSAMGWVAAVLVGLILLFGGIVAAVLGGLSLIEKIRGTATVKAETKASEDGPGRIEFDLHKRGLEELRLERKEDVSEMKASLREINDKLDVFSGDQYAARGRMHRRLNRLENAMHFWAGKLAGAGDEDAKRLQAIIDSNRAEDGE